MVVAPGGMPGPRTCTPPFPNPTLIVVVFCHCWNNGGASSLLYEPPYTEPYVRWCGRTAEVTPPPTRLKQTVSLRCFITIKLERYCALRKLSSTPAGQAPLATPHSSIYNTAS